MDKQPPRGRVSALVVVDVQNDFVDGSLAVPGAAAVPAAVNRLRAAASWRVVALTRDWHPAGHVSFASTHGAAPFTETELPDGGGRQALWPDHCVQGTRGAELSAALEQRPDEDLVVDKGERPDVDSYSAFFDNRRASETGLRAALVGAGVTDVYVCGLALDYCVGLTALDAARLGFRTHVVVDATRAVTEAGGTAMRTRLAAAGVALPHAADVESGDHGPRADAEDYLARHGVRRVMEHLCARLVLERPADPRAFMAAELEALHAAGDGAAPLALLDEADAAHAFAAMDPAGIGRVTARQAALALEHMGVPPKDCGTSGDVTGEQFLALARSAGVVQ